MLKQAENQHSDQATGNAPSRISRFGSTTDPVEAGRRGGKASVLSRRLRHQRQLEEMILASNNGAAKAKVLEIRMRREAELDAERIRLDSFVHRLITEADGLEQTIEDLRTECDELRVARHALHRRVTALEQRAAVLDSDDAIDDALRAIGEERATAAAYRLGWAVDEDADVEA